MTILKSKINKKSSSYKKNFDNLNELVSDLKKKN